MFKVIETYEEACEYSQAGLLWCKERRGWDYHPDEEGYWLEWDTVWWDREKKAGILYAILIEE